MFKYTYQGLCIKDCVRFPYIWSTCLITHSTILPNVHIHLWKNMCVNCVLIHGAHITSYVVPSLQLVFITLQCTKTSSWVKSLKLSPFSHKKNGGDISFTPQEFVQQEKKTPSSEYLQGQSFNGWYQ